MRREPVCLAVVKLTVLGMLMACAHPRASFAHQGSPSPEATERTYIPLSRVTETWGLLHYSNQWARLAAFEGSMQLESVGVMPDTTGCCAKQKFVSCRHG
jgi:hypothetical protein